MGPLVSVVIPTYNHAHFLGRALQSVIDQTYPHWEALVVDNHSKDETDAVVKDLGDSRIRLLKIHNQGVIAASRNLGMREAKGEWIAFLDSDDCWYAGKLGALVAAAHPDGDCDVVSNDELMVDTRTGARQVLRHGPGEPDFYRVLLVDGNRLSPSATSVRRAFLEQHAVEFDESQDYVAVEDYGLWLDLARHGARFRFVPEVLGEFVVHGSNNSGQAARQWKNVEALLRHHVFDVQQFAASREGLWKEVAPRLGLGIARQHLAEGRVLMGIRRAVGTFFDAPAGTASYLARRLKRAAWRSGT